MASHNVVELTTANWDKEVIHSDKPVLVDFWAPWCGPCRQLGPTIDRLADQYAGRAKVGKLNVDESPEIAVQYRITVLPQVLIFQGGDSPKEQMVGIQRENDLAKRIDRLLESSEPAA